MRCVYPLRAERTRTGVRIKKKTEAWSASEIPLPCGQCIECKLERTRQWAVRILHESQLHEQNWFVTLTEDQVHTDNSLHHKPFQDFMKRVRATRTCFDPSTWQHVPRYFMCGEYGEQKGRRHWHAIIFGLALNDLQKLTTTLWESPWLTELWGRGQVTIGVVNFQTASYVAAYCTKKITGNAALEHYLDADTGELRTPEYARMSLKPGIAQRWIEKYTQDVYGHDHVIVNGREQKAPRFYDKYLETVNPEQLEQHKIKRIEKAKATEGENTKQKLKARETITRARLAQRQRSL